MPKKYNNEKKVYLEQNKSFNKNTGKVKDELFNSNYFFDPDDLIQVKYEMLRRVEKDKYTISQVSKAFGFSRTSFYKIHEAFKTYGFPGLLPRQKGPHKAHKLSEKVMEFIKGQLNQNPDLKPKDLVGIIRKEFGFEIHKRSIGRALERDKKKRNK